jgi:hypothetical protein
MKIFLSYCAADKPLAEQIRLKIESAGHQTISGDLIINSAKHLKQVLSAMLREADAYVAVISSDAQNSNWLVWEWQMALELSWEKPDKTLVGVVVGNIEPPPFLQGRDFLRVTDESQKTSSIENILDYMNTSSPSDVPEELKQKYRNRRAEVINEISLFRLSEEELEKQRQWIVEKIAYISRIEPDSIDIAKLQMKLSDILKRMGKEHEVVPLLQTSLNILEKNRDIAAPTIAKAQMKLAKALDKIGDHDGAINQLCHAMDLCGMESNPNLAKQQIEVFKSKLPELSNLLSTAIVQASSETAQHARRLIELIDSTETNQYDRKNDDNLGGEL